MNSRGFTLVELVATIALLSIIAIISFVSINAVIKQSQVNDCDSIVKNIKVATSEYVGDHRYDKDFSVNNFNAGYLVDNKYLSSPIVNPFDKTNIDPSSIKILITLNNDYTVKEVEISEPAVLKECHG